MYDNPYRAPQPVGHPLAPPMVTDGGAPTLAYDNTVEAGFSVRQTDSIERVIRSREYLSIFVSAVSGFIVPLARVSDGNVDAFLSALRDACPPSVEFVQIGK